MTISAFRDMRLGLRTETGYSAVGVWDMELLLHWLARTVAPDYAQPWENKRPEWEVEFHYEIRADGALNESCNIPLWNYLFDGADWVERVATALPVSDTQIATEEHIGEVVAAAKGGLVYVWSSEEDPSRSADARIGSRALDFTLVSPGEIATLLPLGEPWGEAAYRIWVGPTDEGSALFEDPATWQRTLIGDEPDPGLPPLWSRTCYSAPFVDPPWLELFWSDPAKEKGNGTGNTYDG